MLSRSGGCPLSSTGRMPLDIVGTGGDGKKYIQYIYCHMLCRAGTRRRVTGYGNYGVSSGQRTSALEYHGCGSQTDESILRRSLDESSVCYPYAPLFSPALKSVASVPSSTRAYAHSSICSVRWPTRGSPVISLWVCILLGRCACIIIFLQYEGIEVLWYTLLDGDDEISLHHPSL